MTETRRTKKGHYLPKFYLAGFTAGGTEKSELLVFDRELGQVRSGKPISVGYERYFYALPGKDPDSFEQALAKDEDAIAAIVRAVDGAPGTQPDERALETLVYFTALMHLRMPAFREHHLPQISQHYDQIAELWMVAPHAWERYVESARKNGKQPVSRQRFERARKAVLEGKLRFEAQPAEHLRIMADHIADFTKILLRRTWSVVVAPEGTGGFVTCDMPVALYWNVEGAPAIPPAFGSPDAEVFMPLTRRSGLVGRAATDIVIIEGTSMVAHLNTKIINESRRFIFAPDRGFGWLSNRGTADGAALEARMREMVEEGQR